MSLRLHQKLLPENRMLVQWSAEPGGAMDCAGARIENMNWFDAALCYAVFIECLAQNVISCAIDGCVVQ